MSRAPQRLRYFRIAVALVVLAGFAAAFSDFRQLLPAGVAPWLASTQLIPSLVALATGASFAIGGMLVILLTLAGGRIYCSTLCPLGLLQDVISRVAGVFRRQPHRLPPARPHTWLRQLFLWATVGGVAAGGSGLTLTLLDPYSNFGRIASTLLRPVLTKGNNLLVDASAALGFQGPHRIDVHWAGTGVLLLAAAFLLLIVVLVALRGRLYCNTVCPVGTLLGLISRHALFRLRLDQSACTKCTECLRHCKAQCIDLRAGTIDASRCVACYNCVSVCDQGGIGYAFTDRFVRTPSGAAPRINGRPPDPQRRSFLASTATAVAGATVAGPIARAVETVAKEEPPFLVRTGQDSRAIAPPGAGSVSRFLDRCTSCQLCVSACPTQVLQPALLEYGIGGLLRPRLDYNASFCNFDCVRCTEVCPAGALDRLLPEEKQVVQIGLADFHRDRCIVVTNGTDCAACSEHCPTKAVGTEPYGVNLRLPVLKQDLCIGCGACDFACPAKPRKAIVVTGRREHAWARKAVEKKATLPGHTDDFPF